MSVDTAGERQRIEALVKKAVEDLGEHVDSVRVFVTYNVGGGATAGFSWSSGNWYATYGQVISWLKETEAREQSKAVSTDHEEGA